MKPRLLLLALAAVACQPANDRQVAATVTPAEHDAIADTVSKVTTDLLAAMQSVDAGKLATLYSRSRDYAFVGEDGSVCRTPEVCQKLNKEAWSSVRSMQIRVLDSKVAVPSPTVAVQTMTIAGSVSPTSGKTIVIDKAAFTIVWVREADGWKILSFHQSFLPPKTQ
jgi:ketosteroid isomerase-like protein